MYDTKLVHQVLAAAAGGTFVLAVLAGVTVGAGASPPPGAKISLSAASASPAVPAVTGQDLAGSVTPTTAAAPLPVAPPVTSPKVTVPPTTRAPRPVTVPTTAAPAPAAPAPVVAPPAALVAAARRIPADAEVQAAISGLVQRVGGLLRIVHPTPAQIAQAGDQVCTAFDGGQTFAQVKATGLSMIPTSITVTAATADWAVRTAVSMYCPDHASKLV